MIYRQKSTMGTTLKVRKKTSKGAAASLGPEGKFYRRKHRPRG